MKTLVPSTHCFDKAYVVFVDNVSLWWLKLLKPGFRHCYLLFSSFNDRVWIEINPYSNQTKVQIYDFGDSLSYNLAVAAQKDCTVCEVCIVNAPPKCAPLGFFSCVEMVKRVLGMHSLLVITPFQLYKIIKVVGKKS